jgi:Cu2+-exporting ATPase
MARFSKSQAGQTTRRQADHQDDGGNHDHTPPLHEAEEHDQHTAAAHDGHSAHDSHAGRGSHDKHAGHDPEAFRRKFWLSLLLTLPIVATSHMVMDWFGYSLDFPGMAWVGPLLGSFVFFYGGWPFLVGGVREARDQAPGMMLLISMELLDRIPASSFGKAEPLQ